MTTIGTMKNFTIAPYAGSAGNNMEQQFYISENRLLELLETEAKFIALENGGVDNWEWYGPSLNEYLDLCGAYNFEEVALQRIQEFTFADD